MNQKKVDRKRPTLMYVLGLAPQKIGGMEKFLRYFAVALDAAGWDTVLCFDGPISPEFLEYVRFPFVHVESLDHQENLGLACAGRLWKLLWRYRPQSFVYAFHGVMRCFPWLARISGCRRIYFNDHSSRPPGQVAAPMSLLKRLVGRCLTFPLTGVCSVSEFTRRTGEVMGLSAAPSVVAPNGVEVRDFDPGRRSAFRERWGLGQRDLVVTQVCWMIDEKGVDAMLRAASLLLGKHGGVRFLFVGDGPKLAAYRKLAAELGIEGAVTFTGLLHNPTDMGVFDASDVYCQPSIWQEASGLAVLEAMSLKVPVVVSDTGGLREHVEDGKSGFVVPVGDSEAISAALERLVGDRMLRSKMGEAGLATVNREHRIEQMADSYVEIMTG